MMLFPTIITKNTHIFYMENPAPENAFSSEASGFSHFLTHW